MISHEKKFIFVHIPRAAGTSIIHFLGEPPQPVVGTPFDPDDDGKFSPPPTHLRARDYVAYGRATQDQFDGYFKFAFVRNPWSRMVSEYKYGLRASRFDFRTFLFEHFPRPAWSDEYCHVLPQYDFVHDAEGRLMVDFVGRFEQLQQSMDEVCRRLGLPPRPLPHDNASLSVLHRARDKGWCDMLKAVFAAVSPTQWRNTFPRYRDYYDEETKAFVARLYRKDIDAFGYEF